MTSKRNPGDAGSGTIGYRSIRSTWRNFSQDGRTTIVSSRKTNRAGPTRRTGRSRLRRAHRSRPSTPPTSLETPSTSAARSMTTTCRLEYLFEYGTTAAYGPEHAGTESLPAAPTPQGVMVHVKDWIRRPPTTSGWWRRTKSGPREARIAIRLRPAGLPELPCAPAGGGRTTCPTAGRTSSSLHPGQAASSSSRATSFTGSRPTYPDPEGSRPDIENTGYESSPAAVRLLRRARRTDRDRISELHLRPVPGDPRAAKAGKPTTRA